MSERKVAYKIEGLDCQEEVAILKKVIGERQGVKNLDFNILSAKMTVTYDSLSIDSGEIISLVSRTGMRATEWEEANRMPTPFWKFILRPLSCGLSFLFLLIASIIHFYFWHASFVEIGPSGQTLPLLAKTFYLLSILAGIWMIFPKAYFAVRQIRPDINLLMIIAILGAIGIGEWFEAATVAFLFSLALLLEEMSIEKARRAVYKLLELAPLRAFVVDRGKIRELAVEEVEIGQTILIRPGEKVPLDGVIEEGKSSINQSAITGEALPVSKEKGDEVFAGTLNEEGALEVKVTKRAHETTLAKIIALVEEARAKRSENEQWVEKFARVYTPIMLLLAVIVASVPPLLFHQEIIPWIYRGLVLLVIACPCALVISTPVSMVSALTSSARNGVLVKGGIFLELMGKIKAIALDKTGTLTFGHPEVQKIVPLNQHTEEDILIRAASLEQKTDHPIARAVLHLANAKKLTFPRAENFEIVKGKGAKGNVFGKNYWIGSHRFMHDMGQETEEIHLKALELEDAGHTMLAVGTDDHVCGLISLADSPRTNIQTTIAALKTLGINKVIMLTGDNEKAASALASLIGVDEFYADLLPEDKIKAVRSLQKKYGKVAMIGDGVNDAPALATANVGIAMGGMGADVAIEVSDIALMSDDLAKVPWLIQHARRAVRIIKQNIAFALGIKGIVFVLALFQLTTLWMAIAADTGATLLVIFNALRLLKR